MKGVVLLLAVSTATAAAAAEATVVSYNEGELNFSLKGTGTVSVVAQVDFKYISAVTGVEALARAVSEPVKVKLTGGETPVTIKVQPPAGTILEVEVVLLVDGKEVARQPYYF